MQMQHECVLSITDKNMDNVNSNFYGTAMIEITTDDRRKPVAIE